MLNRRDFVRSAVGMGMGGLAGRFSHPGLFADETPSRKATKYIDMHTHIGTTWNGDEELTVDGLLKWMDEHDVERSVVLPLVSPESSSFIQLTEPALAAGKLHPDRLIPFCSIDPRTSYRGGAKGLADIIRGYVDKGAKGFGEHKVGLPFDDPLMMRVYDACEEVGIPLLFHIDNIRGTDKPGLPGVENAVRTHPKLNFIGHGPGWWVSISGGITLKDLGEYPNSKVQPGGAIDDLMTKYPNIYGDLSAGSGSNAISRDREFGREFLIRRQDRVLFGTDYLKPGQEVPQFEVLNSLDLPAEVQAKVYKGNAMRLLGLT